MALPDDLPPLLRTHRLGHQTEWHASIDSTNRRAAELAEAGAPEGTLVGAEHQVAGRGRHGRRWEAEPGQNLLVSVLLRPTLPPERLGLVPLAAGVAVAEAIAAQVPPLAPALKWPNDVLLGGKKVCGMLMEGYLGGARPYVVLGIGLNVNQTAFPEGLLTPPTSLRLEVGRALDRAPLLAAILDRLEAGYDGLAAADDAVLAAFEARMAGLGARVGVRLTPGPGRLTGTALGLDPGGGLRLLTDEGVRTVHAGDVTVERDAV